MHQRKNTFFARMKEQIIRRCIGMVNPAPVLFFSPSFHSSSSNSWSGQPPTALPLPYVRLSVRNWIWFSCVRKKDNSARFSSLPSLYAGKFPSAPVKLLCTSQKNYPRETVHGRTLIYATYVLVNLLVQALFPLSNMSSSLV